MKKDRLEKSYAMLQEQRQMEHTHLSEMQSMVNDYKKRGQVIQTHLLSVKEHFEMQNYEKGQQEFQQFIKSEVHPEQKNYCANPVINAVLKYKVTYAISLGIPVETDILVSAELGMDDISLCNLFSNLLDNAIEACQQIEAEDKRWISCNVFLAKGVMSVKVENACLPKGKRKKPVTGKRIQGYGHKILQGIMTEYKGHIKYVQEGERFTATVFLPLRPGERNGFIA